MTLNAYVHVSWDGYRLILDHIENFNLQFFLIWSGIFLLLPMSGCRICTLSRVAFR